jgi:hypothetical protein
MSDREPTIIKLEDVLTGLVQQETSPGGLVTSWVVVCEVLDPDSGGLDLVTLADATAPYWRHRGMLEHAAIPSEHDDDEDDE